MKKNEIKEIRSVQVRRPPITQGGYSLRYKNVGKLIKGRKDIRIGVPRKPCTVCGVKKVSRVRIVFELDSGYQLVENICVAHFSSWGHWMVDVWCGGKIRNNIKEQVICAKCTGSAVGGIWFGGANTDVYVDSRSVEMLCIKCILDNIY